MISGFRESRDRDEGHRTVSKWDVVAAWAVLVVTLVALTFAS